MRSKIKRIKTGIKGFDQLVEGGFPEGSAILYAGSPGTGKTLFSLEYLYKGATEFNEKGLFVSFEQGEKDIVEQAELMGWDLNKLMKEKRFHLLTISAENITSSTAKRIITYCKKNKITRLVIDSLTTLSTNAPIYEVTKDLSVKDVMAEQTCFSPPIIGDAIVKRFIYRFISMLKKVDGLTSMLISEASEKEAFISRDTISEFLCDGVILVTFESMGGEYSRSLIVRKMRKTRNDEDIHPLEIGDKGLIIHNID